MKRYRWLKALYIFLVVWGVLEWLVQEYIAAIVCIMVALMLFFIRQAIRED